MVVVECGFCVDDPKQAIGRIKITPICLDCRNRLFPDGSAGQNIDLESL